MPLVKADKPVEFLPITAVSPGGCRNRPVCGVGPPQTPSICVCQGMGRQNFMPDLPERFFFPNFWLSSSFSTVLWWWYVGSWVATVLHVVRVVLHWQLGACPVCMFCRKKGDFLFMSLNSKGNVATLPCMARVLAEICLVCLAS